MSKRNRRLTAMLMAAALAAVCMMPAAAEELPLDGEGPVETAMEMEVVDPDADVTADDSALDALDIEMIDLELEEEQEEIQAEEQAEQLEEQAAEPDLIAEDGPYTDAANGTLQTEAQTEVVQIDNGPDVVPEGIRFAKSYKEVYEAMKEFVYEPYVLYDDGLDYAVEESMSSDMDQATGIAPAAGQANMAQAPAAAQEAAVVTAETEAAYSDTNVREKGVDEADIIKTDGKYIYILKDSTDLLIVTADGAQTALAGRAVIGEEAAVISRNAADMYVDGDRLSIICREYETVRKTDQNGYYGPLGEYTSVYTYDISDRTAPVLIGSVYQDGYYEQSRKIGDVIYLYTTQYPNITDTYQESELIPYVNGKAVEPGNICIPECVNDASYLLISSVRQSDPSVTVDAKALVSGAGDFYVSRDNLYAMNADYSGSSTKTEIVKFGCSDGTITGIGACKVRGGINNSFSIDEYNGYLRVLTTYTGSELGEMLESLSNIVGGSYYDSQRWVRHNALYVLDPQMRYVSRLTGIAKDEEIRSARFFGDTVYFVTFRNTDPLFTADLSDPAQPKLVGELKVTGFSSYLHPYGENRLLGIGYEADEDTGWTTGLKLSMFDTSDPYNVTEIGRLVIDGITDCWSISDYKAILADGEKNLIGFFYNDRYLVFGWNEAEAQNAAAEADAQEAATEAQEAGFERIFVYDYFEDLLTGGDYTTMRGLYIGDELYLADGRCVAAFNMADGFHKDTVLKFE